MKKKKIFDNIAKSNGYHDKNELLMDYGFIPTVLTPNHRKSEIVLLLYRSIKNNKK